MKISHPISLLGYDTNYYIQESISFLQEHIPPEGYFVGFSGGKDSIVTLQLCRLAGVKHTAYFSCTYIDPPEIYKFIRTEYPDVQWLYPKQSIYKAIIKKAPPLWNYRWCCDFLKKDPAKQITLKNRVMGIRAEESARRASRPRIDTFMGQTTYKAIFLWPEWAIWEAIEMWKLPYPHLYEEGFGRIGCVVCPYIMGASKGAIAKRAISQQRWPGIWRTYERAVKKWFVTKQAEDPNRVRRHNNADNYWQSYLLGFEDKRGN